MSRRKLQGRASLMLAASLLLPPVASGSAASALPPGIGCDALAVARTAAGQGRILCVRLIRDPVTAQPTGLESWRSADDGRTWQGGTASGIPLSATTLLSAVLSANDDSGWLLQTFDSGLYSSRDGLQWQLSDPLATQPSTFRSVEPGQVTLPQLGSMPAVLFAHPGRIGPVDQSAVIVSGLHLPLFRSADETVRLVQAASGEGRYSRLTVRLANRVNATGDEAHAVVGTCTDDFNCSGPSTDLPKFEQPVDLFPAGNFATSGQVFVVTRDSRDRRLHLYKSSDAGTRFAPVPGAQKIFDQDLHTGLNTGFRRMQVGMASAYDAPNVVLLRIQYLDPRPATYTEQIWRSTDSGKSWINIGRSKWTLRNGLQGNLPWSGPASDAPQYSRAMIAATRSGHFILAGFRPDTAQSLAWCSVDGLVWRARCA